ncbi:hypothetical protein LJC49_06780 [Ruminococcaceae bacterium OttesenSCG-928-I18]|nr:hypothetical protein [Ruminococcaceae bacterium OttesenSCG-928-I18]
MVYGLQPFRPDAWSSYSSAAESASAPASAGTNAAQTGGVPAVASPSSAAGATGEEGSIARARAEANAAKEVARAECQTCKERKYQDGSDDPGVSFQTPQNIDPNIAASVVMGHEMEHVMHEQAKAKQEGAEVISQSVILHTSICPECGRTYVAGGVTKTVTKHGGEESADAEKGIEKNGSSGGIQDGST